MNSKEKQNPKRAKTGPEDFMFGAGVVMWDPQRDQIADQWM